MSINRKHQIFQVFHSFIQAIIRIQGYLPNMNRFGQWEVVQVAPAKDDIFDPDFVPQKE